MQPQHMNPAEAVQVMRDCGAAQTLGHHWGTFRLADDGIEEATRDLASALKAADIPADRFRAMRPGEVWTPV
jgi:L-ascorbate metabolism protein UlaG (beta-lactamase superfamily)